MVSGSSPEKECAGPIGFNGLKDYRFLKIDDFLLEFVTTFADKKNSDKPLQELIDIEELQKAAYWVNVSNYDLKEINKYLRLYSKNDDRWREAFFE